MRKLLVPFLAFAFAAQAQQTSVLFIGNSYTYVNDLPNTFRQLALSMGETVTVGMSAPGGYTLMDHTVLPATMDAIASQAWTYVVMQEQSQLGALPTDVTDTESGAIQLVSAIEESDECTYPVFYMTWGRQNGDDLNCANFPYMCTYNGMQQGLRDNYVALAEYNDGYTAPVGVAWKVVRDTQPGINLYQSDGSHPSVEGTYLAACVFYCTLFQESCAGASFNSSLPQSTANILQGIASAVVLDSLTTWNLDVANGTDAYITGTSSNGPNDVTFYHPGAGTHLWTCSNGQSSTEANPTFTFSASGTYTFTHTYNDPCGNTDTATWTVDVTIVGVGENVAMEPCKVWSPASSTLEVSRGTGKEMLTLTDLQGRVVLSHRLLADRTRLECPRGLYLYRITTNSGTMQSGKVLVE
ncbi:MAG TPA: hypothetical protein PK760_06950 [Flavobacteriales bacterium]|nr:hypothetical protein [Flavobacteriales bacterium]